MTETKRFVSRISKSADEFKKNYQENLATAEDLQKKLKEWQFQGPPRAVQQERKKGKLLARERLDLLLDEDSPFLEIAPLAGWGQKDLPKGNPLITGIGIVSGVECMIMANVPTVSRATMSKALGFKWNRASEMSLENRLPLIQLLESAGADLTQAFEAFHVNPNPFLKHAHRSKRMVPTVTVVFGTNVAGGAYMAGMSDYVIMIKKQSTLGLAGTKLVKVATGEDADEESIGGAEMHSQISGVSDFLASNESEAIGKAREILAHFIQEKATIFTDAISKTILEPYYDPDEILGIVSPDNKHFYDCREVIARIVDDSRLSEFKPRYGSTLVCSFANIAGVPVGLIGNNGVIFSESAQKGTHFINLCNQRGIPIIFFHNVTGFMVGRKYEESGIVKWGSQMVNAVSNSVVPIISIIIGSSFGAANYAQMGHGFNPRFIFSWPTAKCAVMGPEQLSGVLALLARERAEKRGRTITDEEINAIKSTFISRIENEQSAYYLSSRGIDDGVIDPRDTRMVLAMCLSAVCNVKIDKAFLQGICRL